MTERLLTIDRETQRMIDRMAALPDVRAAMDDYLHANAVRLHPESPIIVPAKYFDGLGALALIAQNVIDLGIKQRTGQ